MKVILLKIIYPILNVSFFKEQKKLRFGVKQIKQYGGKFQISPIFYSNKRGYLVKFN